MADNGKADKLADLPPTDDPYWDQAEKLPTENRQVNKDCRHYLLRTKANEAQCKYCHWGIFLGGEDHILNGHLITAGRLVV